MEFLQNQKCRDLQNVKVSVVILGYKNVNWLKTTVDSFVHTAQSPGWELIVVLNGAHEKVKFQCVEWIGQNLWPLSVLEVSSQRPGAARNFAMEAARGEIYLFLDDDILCFQDLVAALVRIFSDPLVSAAGGGNLTPPGSSALQRANGYVMASYLGAASMSARYRILPEQAVGEHELILCNLAFRRGTFGHGFVRHLISNEENVLLQNMAQSGMKMVHSPDLAVYHRRRENLAGIWEQSGKYGGGRMQNILLLPKTFRFLYLFPALFVLFLPICFILSFYFPWLLLFPLLYLVLAAELTILTFTRTYDCAVIWIMILLPWIHMAYGWGSWRVMGSLLVERKKFQQVAADR